MGHALLPIGLDLRGLLMLYTMEGEDLDEVKSYRSTRRYALRSTDRAQEAVRFFGMTWCRMLPELLYHL